MYRESLQSMQEEMAEQGNAEPGDDEIQAYIDSLDLLDQEEIDSLRD